LKNFIALFAFLLGLALLVAHTAYGPDSVTLVFAGDTAFGENYRIRPEPEFLSGDSRYLPSMKALIPLLSGAGQILLNLETPLTLPNGSGPDGKAYIHWSSPEKSISALKASGVTAVGLANNHTMDQGARGLMKTLLNLENAGLAWRGAGPSLEVAETPLLWSFRIGKRTVTVATFFGFQYRKSYDEKYDFYAGTETAGVNPLDPERLKTLISELRAKTREVYVIIFPHWGNNYKWRTKKQSGLARELIEAGADLVIGHGAHHLQQIEFYQGKCILYGLGNFIFHSPGRFDRELAPSYSLVARLEMADKKGLLKKTLRLYPIQSDNSVTGFRSRPVTQDEFTVVENLLRNHIESEDNLSRIISGRDPLGHYLEIKLP